MATHINPLASATGGLEFARLPAEEIKKISVKRIFTAPALDSMLVPVPGGLHDLALGAISALDANCATCRMNAVHCTGHCGHIELPTPCYHPQFIDLTLRLVRAKCIYCHNFRLSPNIIHQTVCQLRLLQHGLVKEFQDLLRFRLGSKRKKTREDDEMDVDDSEEDIDHLIDRRERFVSRSIRKARKDKDMLPFHKNPVAIQARKVVIADFMQLITLPKKCIRCQGVSPSYRKDQRTKIFRKPLPIKAREAMKLMEKKAANPLIYLQQENKQKAFAKKPMVNGDIESATNGTDEHGAEEEIALKDALQTKSSSEVAEVQVDLETQAYMTPAEVHAALTLLFEREQDVVSLLFAPLPGRKHVSVSADMFFIHCILVPPNKYRPLARQGANQILEAQQNGVLNRVIGASNDFQRLIRISKIEDPEVRKPSQAQLLQAGITLQESVNGLIDNPPGPTSTPREQGVKQVLEKKEGLFRMNMMGKRVNYAARSVISPDPNIETNEIGVPLVFAKKLTYPEPVTTHNFEAMSRAVINGIDKYPGAAAIENEHGQVMSLRRKTSDQRKALAKQLLTSTVPGVKGENSKKVYRHLQTGDVVIMNRQPTLHKPSMMGHRARVLQNEKTIRMHYANCNTYNADFDGDEMNMHFPQNELARSEALQIADTDHQYLSATAGKPLRGLIQDHISMGVQFTSRDNFFDREQYQQLLYNCLRPEDYNTVHEKILMVEPAILKPKMFWTGKQVVTTILKNITPDRFRGINMTGKSSTSSDQWGEVTVKDPSLIEVTRDLVAHVDTEQVVIFKDGEHLCGILDKSQLGPAAGGLIHSIHELYGHITAGKLLSILGRLLTRFLNERAWTCGIDDLYLTNQGDNTRRQALSKTKRVGFEVATGYVQLKGNKPDEINSELTLRLENVLRNDNQMNSLDQLYKSKTKVITDEVSKVLPRGLRKPFPRNQMQAMTLSGAKGSNVNANLISCNLGQQVLEGRRVPTMVSGKTLPSFRAFETDPVAGGYVSGRFLTGIKPQEYFFHAMSGREGLIDTAVKTAKSGYLQRCIVKGLEGLKTEYDSSVREASTGSIVQFLYGEDGLEVTKQKHLKEFTFLAENHQSVMAFMRAEEVVPKFIQNSKSEAQKVIMKAAKKGRPVAPITDEFSPANYFGSTSEDFATSLSAYLKDNPALLIRDKKTNPEGKIGKRTFQGIMELKYMRSVVDAGEAVGVVAAQSVGEPSTQMTLNTFHLAGHSAKNVTLGIPRLREIIMTASAKIMTPTMTLKPNEELSNEDVSKFAKGISKLSLAHIIKDLTVTERAPSNANSNEKLYDIRLDFYDAHEYMDEYAITVEDVSNALQTKFLIGVEKALKNEFRKKAREADLSQVTAAVPQIGASVGLVEEERPTTQTTTDREGGEDDIDEDADMDDAKDAAARARRDDDFDEPDDDEQQIIADESAGESSDEEEEKEREKDSVTKNSKVLNQSTQDSDLSDEEAEAEQEALKQVNPHLKRYHFSKTKGNSCRITLSYSSNTPKVLLQPIVEKCAHSAVIQSIPGLGVCSMFMEEVYGPDGKPLKNKDSETGKEEDVKEPIITCEGVNLLAMRHYQDVINPHTLYTNSVHDMLKLYGVEAARMTIVKEIDTVFKGHGISVDNRHINLIADAMTQTGSYQSFSRHGLVKEGGSILAKMSFETVMGFLKEAVLYGEKDLLLGPSARIVAGRRGNVGTGSFDVIMPVS